MIADDPSNSGEDALDIPEVNSMRSDLNQLIAMLEGQPDDDDDFMPLEGGLGSDLTDDLGLQQWLENDEWEDTGEDSAAEGEDGTVVIESSLDELGEDSATEGEDRIRVIESSLDELD